MSNNTVCYTGAGKESGDIPCGFSSISQCCGQGWDCLTNGLCRNHGTTAYSQGSCTDPSFINCLSFCNQDQYEGYTEVSRCEQNSNSWCCAGIQGQGSGGVNCCSTNSTTSLEPYPLSTIEGPGNSATTITSLPSTATLKSISSSFSPTSSPASTTSQGSVTVSTSSPAPSTSQSSVSHNHNSTKGIAIGVPIAVIIVLALMGFFFWRKRTKKQGLVGLKGENAEDPQSIGSKLPELEENPTYELDVSPYELSHPNAPRHELD